MGATLARGWLQKGRGGVPADQMILVDPKPSDAVRALAETHGVALTDKLDAQSAAAVADLVMAVKPKLVAPVLTELAPSLPQDALVLSIAAGVPLRVLEAAAPGRPAVRAMPNTPAAIGKGVTVCVANEAAHASAFRTRAEKLMRPGGHVAWIEDERQMDAVTAVSGSGPAYVFLFAEALAAAAEAEGLPRELAQDLAVQTVAGAGALLEQERDATRLRNDVTSPGGTTQAGLDVLMGGAGLPGLVRNAVAAAERRGRQLGAQSD